MDEQLIEPKLADKPNDLQTECLYTYDAWKKAVDASDYVTADRIIEYIRFFT